MKTDKLWIGGACVVLGLFIAFQMKFIQVTYLNGATPTQKTTEILNELVAIKEERKALIEEVEDLERQLYIIQESASEESAVVKNLTEEMNKFKTFAGLTKVAGEGVIITLDNPPTDSSFPSDVNIVYDYRLVLELINELNSAGAEAISINEQRMINSTEIRFAGTQVNVNTIPISTPFIIKAIGNSGTLEGALNQRFGIISNLRDSGYYVEVKRVDIMEIGAFNGTIRFRYANTVK